MHITIGRRTRITALGAGLITAAALALATAGPAAADTADTGGTAVLTMPRTYFAGIASHGITLIAGAPATSSYNAGPSTKKSNIADTFTVTGGNGEVSNFYGIVDLGGAIVAIGQKGATATITNLELNFFNGTLTGEINGSTKQVVIADVGGDLSTSTGTGTETFTATALTTAPAGAKALNTALNTTAFTSGKDLGAFTTTFDVTIS